MQLTDLDKDAMRFEQMKGILRKIEGDYHMNFHHELILKDKEFKGRILDVGGHFSQFSIVAKLQNKSRDIHVIEVSMFAAMMASYLAHIAEAELTVYNMSFEKVKIKGEFDSIVLSNIIEHLEDPEFLITWSLNKLKKGGVIFLTMPFRNHHWDPYHKHFFDTKDEDHITNITTLLDKADVEYDLILIDGKEKKTEVVPSETKNQLDFWIKVRK